MKYGKIFDYRNKDEAEIGRRYIFSDNLMEINNPVDGLVVIRELVRVNRGPYPFRDERGAAYQFCREVIEEPELMTNRQMAELLAKGYGEWRHTGDETIFPSSLYTENYENKPVDGDIRIRPWGSSEWVKPTVDIYNDFCRPVCKEDME